MAKHAKTGMQIKRERISAQCREADACINKLRVATGRGYVLRGPGLQSIGRGAVVVLFACHEFLGDPSEKFDIKHPPAGWRHINVAGDTLESCLAFLKTLAKGLGRDETGGEK